MRFLLAFTLLFAITIHSPAQSSDSIRIQKVLAQADKMGKAYLDRDYDGFLNYTYSGLIRLSGGKAKLKSMLAGYAKISDSTGVVLNNIHFFSPSRILQGGNELQLTLTQQTAYIQGGDTAVVTSTLIGISGDNGLHWTFLDTHNKTIDQMRQFFPNLNKGLVIKSSTQTVHPKN